MTHLILAAVIGAAAPPGPVCVHPPSSAFQQSAPAASGRAPAGSRQVQGSSGAADPVAGAYFEFMLGRQLEDRGDIDGAIAALRRAMALHPASADLPAELSALYARQSRVRESVEAASAALAINPKHGEANRVLGSIYASLAERDPGGVAPGGGQASYRQLALDYLGKSLAASSPITAVGVRLTIARIEMQASAFDKAIPVLRQLLADEPWLPQGVAMLAQAYTESGQTASAITLLEEAVATDPSFSESLAAAYERDERWSDAARAYEQAAEQSPRDTALQTRWAFALLSMPDNAGAKRARELLSEVTRANSTEGWPLYLLARAERALGDLDASEASARRLLAISPGSTSGAHALAQVLEARRQWPALIEALEPVAAKPPARGREADTALILTHLGFAYLEVGRAADAVAAFERASTLDPSDGVTRVYLAQALVAAKHYDRALSLVRAERQARPRDGRLARLEADALKGLGRFDEGASVLTTLVQSGADASAVQNLAEYYASVHSYAEAAEALKGGMARFPDNPDVLFQYGAMLERQSLHAEAEKVFRQVLARDPDHGPTLNYLGYTLVERGVRRDEAVALIKRAVALDPHNGAYLDSLGWAYFKLDQPDLAEPHLRAAAEQLPGDSVVQDHWGDLLARRGRHADAVEAWRRALAGDGDQIERPKIERKISDALNALGKR